MIPSLNSVDNLDKKGGEVETTLYEDEDEEGDFGMSEGEEFDDEEGEFDEDFDDEEGEIDEDFEDEEDDDDK